MPIMAKTRSTGITALSFFFIFGGLMSGLTSIMLLFPGTALDSLWQLNPAAQAGFATMGKPAVLLMLAVCAACTTAALGLWRCARWGYWTALAILSINLIGDTTNFFLAHDRRTLIGLPIGGAMIAYLISKRRAFA